MELGDVAGVHEGGGVHDDIHAAEYLIHDSLVPDITHHEVQLDVRVICREKQDRLKPETHVIVYLRKLLGMLTGKI